MESTQQNAESLLTTKLISNITDRGQPSVTELSLSSLALSKGELNILLPDDRRNDLHQAGQQLSHWNGMVSFLRSLYFRTVTCCALVGGKELTFQMPMC